jgi:hypothetical protein
MTNYVQLTPTGPYKFTIVESRRKGESRIVGFRENMDIKFLRPHEIIASIVTHEPGERRGVHAVANGSEAKIADSMLRVLHQQGVLGDASADLRFSLHPGCTPERRDMGACWGVHGAGGGGLDLPRNRFGERVAVDRAGRRWAHALAEPGRELADAVALARRRADRSAAPRARRLAGSMSAGRLFGPMTCCPPRQRTVEHARTRASGAGEDCAITGSRCRDSPRR